MNVHVSESTRWNVENAFSAGNSRYLSLIHPLPKIRTPPLRSAPFESNALRRWSKIPQIKCSSNSWYREKWHQISWWTWQQAKPRKIGSPSEKQLSSAKEKELQSQSVTVPSVTKSDDPLVRIVSFVIEALNSATSGKKKMIKDVLRLISANSYTEMDMKTNPGLSRKEDGAPVEPEQAMSMY